MNTRKIAEEYRLSHWAGITRERKESGLSVRAYCRQAGFHENVYYYWQRKLREAACEELSNEKAPLPATPAGWALCATETKTATLTSSAQIAMAEQLTVEISGMRITAGGRYPVEQMAQLLRELQKIC